MSVDHRRANYIPMTIDRQRLDYLRAKYVDLRYVLPPVKHVVVTAAFENNLPALAHELLGDTTLWWALGLYNGIVSPLEDLTVGKQVSVPDVTELLKLLDAANDDLAGDNRVVTL